MATEAAMVSQAMMPWLPLPRMAERPRAASTATVPAPSRRLALTLAAKVSRRGLSGPLGCRPRRRGPQARQAERQDEWRGNARTARSSEPGQERLILAAFEAGQKRAAIAQDHDFSVTN